jgi:subtilisin family serine protease
MPQCKSSLTAVCGAVAVVASLLAAPLAAQAAEARERVIVAFKAGSADAARAAIVQAGGRVLDEIDDADAFAVSMPRSAVQALRAARGVDYVEADVVRTIDGRVARSVKPLLSPPGTPQTVPYGIAQVQANDAAFAAPASWKPKVCIIDSGIDAQHEDLAGNILSGKNFTASGSWNTDENSHGTHVAGTISALNNGVGVVGVSPDARFNIVIAKVFDASGSASSSVITKAINYCGRQKANVISMSLGSADSSRTEKRALDKLQGQGVLLVAAAGNTGVQEYHYPASLASVMSVAANDSAMQWATFSTFNDDVEISAPGVAVLSTVPLGSQTAASAVVGSTSYSVAPMGNSPRAEGTGALADFGFGDAPAPGSMAGKVCLISRGNISFADKATNCQSSGGVAAIIYNNAAGPVNGTIGTAAVTIPVVEALQSDGALMLAQVGQSTTVKVFGTNDVYAEYDGTSMATPHVSGVAALVWSYHQSCTAEQIRSSLKKSALDIGDAGVDFKTGAGLVQAKAAHDRITAMGCGN